MPQQAVCRSSSSPTRPSQLALGARALFAVVFFGLELAGVLWGQRVPDHVLGFQMFNEASRFTIHLGREVASKRGRVVVPLPDGHWQAPDRNGTLHDYAWQDRVHWPLNVLGVSMHASYGLDAQLYHLQAALDDEVRHLPEDTRTLALVADVDTIRNGAPGPTLHLRAEKP